MINFSADKFWQTTFGQMCCDGNENVHTGKFHFVVKTIIDGNFINGFWFLVKKSEAHQSIVSSNEIMPIHFYQKIFAVFVKKTVYGNNVHTLFREMRVSISKNISGLYQIIRSNFMGNINNSSIGIKLENAAFNG